MKILDYAGLAAQIAKEKERFAKIEQQLAALQQTDGALDHKITNGLTTLSGSKQNKFNDVLTRTSLMDAVTDIAEGVSNLQVIGVKRSGVIFLEVSFTSTMEVTWSIQDCFTLTAEAWKCAVSIRLQPIAAYYQSGEFLKLMNPLITKTAAGDKFQIGENNAPKGGAARGMVVYPALNP